MTTDGKQMKVMKDEMECSCTEDKFKLELNSKTESKQKG